ncbi:EpsD family peptidyl-prolyl cis-trans isomerase [Chitiniphilus purpureus]|uniref:peptidylprolyl isomerase n=1 Tax=Chitiniphilus purpureus TaxID=2981137 RepID=A0ABY6DJX8_9NEIS|nr:EpsD family peptidyl-prolyl cis-trans isomerase [Chitiniphilus sp. CD1]UXY14637.1 EpsD family peptidyl-prolyl cis-trans isomerase [Chitiniphilus sp. CD1]
MPNTHPMRYGLLLLILALAACGDKEAAKSPSQVLARVNDKEITVHQLNYLLARQRQPVSDADKQRLLDQLVDQEVLVQKAEELKLDRDPQVLQALEQSRRQLLAQAAAERVIGKPTEPSAQERSKFYAENPALFAERRIYDFVSFSVPAAAAADKSLLTSLDTAKSPADTEAALTAAGVQYQSARVRRPAEQLPMPMLQRIASMQQGDIVSIPDGKERVVLLQLEGSRPAPVSQSDADPVIKAYLSNGQVEREARSRISGLRQGAKVEYVKRYAAVEAAAQTSAPVADSAEHLKAGVKGLK